jgi:hypothetical protein
VSPASLFWHNLLLLGFDPVTQAQRNNALLGGRIDLSPNMFDRPNARGMQLLLHWLLSLLRGSCAAQAEGHNASPEWRELLTVFAHAYPCVERNQARDFINVVTGALLGFEKGPAAVFAPGTIRKSHFAAPQGDKLYAIFHQLSSYALTLVLARDHPTFAVPSLSLPPLGEPGLLPHLIKAAKAHVVSQAQTYLTKLARMQGAEEQWRAAAETITQEYYHVAAQVSALAPQHPHSTPRIPGQPNVEAESDRALFSQVAHEERMRKLAFVKELHRDLTMLNAKTEQQRKTLNAVLDGAWQPTTISNANLRRLLRGGAKGSSNDGGDVKEDDDNGASDDALLQSDGPLSLSLLVQRWNDSLAHMQSTLTSYLQQQQPTTTGGNNSSYVDGLNEAKESVETHLKEHTVVSSFLHFLSCGTCIGLDSICHAHSPLSVCCCCCAWCLAGKQKLANLRALSHHLRSSLLPELESDLEALQLSLRRAGAYSGLIGASPALIPPTPFRPTDRHTSLAVPATPAMQAAGYARVHFTPSSSVSHQQQQQRATKSRIPDSVRRAAAAQHQYSKPTSSAGARGSHLQLGRASQSQQQYLHTIEDEEHSHLLSPMAAAPASAHYSSTRASGATQGYAGSSNRPISTHYLTPELVTSTSTASSPLLPLDSSHEALATGPHAAAASLDTSTSPQFPKKLVFSPAGANDVASIKAMLDRSIEQTVGRLNSGGGGGEGTAGDQHGLLSPISPHSSGREDGSSIISSAAKPSLNNHYYSAARISLTPDQQRATGADPSSSSASATRQRFVSPPVTAAPIAAHPLPALRASSSSQHQSHPPTSSMLRSVSPRYTASPSFSSHSFGFGTAEQGLLSDDELAPTASAAVPSALVQASRDNDVTVEDVGEHADDDDEDDEEDEVVFGSGVASQFSPALAATAAAPARRSGGSGRRHVDPNAPTPPAVSRTERKYVDYSDDRTPPHAAQSMASGAAGFLSPAYALDGQAGLLDDF